MFRFATKPLKKCPFGELDNLATFKDASGDIAIKTCDLAEGNCIYLQSDSIPSCFHFTISAQTLVTPIDMLITISEKT